jgi:two-component system sensor histidine kinase MprB
VSFRRRITIVSAAAVAVAVLLASALTYVLASRQLYSQVDSQLRARSQELARLSPVLEASLLSFSRHKPGAHYGLPAGGEIGSLSSTTLARLARGEPAATGTGPRLFGRLPPSPAQVRGYQQVVDSDGSVLLRSAPLSLPVDSATRRLARTGGAPVLSDATVGGLDLRVLAEPFGKGRALQIAQPLTEVDSLQSRLRLILVLLDLGGIALAALLGRLVAGAAVAPIRRLTKATEHVTVTRDLSRRIEPTSEDEIGRLAGSFNAMLDALEHSMVALDNSVHAQRQLVADASHELRTPVTSLRTNIEILQQQGEQMDAEDRGRLLGDVVEQISELTLLMNDLIELARGEEPRSDTEELRLDLLVAEVAERARRRSPKTAVELSLEPSVLACVPARLERAVGNLIDNAVKYSPPGSPVEVTLRDGELTVRDHGPGISPEDLRHVFDRFYRGAEARGRPGSGLGLAIVRQVATQQGGTVEAERAAGGGTLMRLRLPGTEPAEDHEGAEHEAGAPV